MSQYILKDHVPCWGCNLDNYDSEGLTYDKTDVLSKNDSSCTLDYNTYNHTNDISKCPNCKDNIDLSKYIKKDKIPCYGCKLP